MRLNLQHIVLVMHYQITLWEEDKCGKIMMIKLWGFWIVLKLKIKDAFPVVCPICGEKDGHLYFHRNRDGDEKGVCGYGAVNAIILHMHLCRLPKWWKNLDKINFEELTSYPNHLEENKFCIDEWINKLNALYNH
mgnify:CR=1 FL=1